MEKDFMEKLTEKESSGTKHRNSNAEDHEDVVGPSGKTIRESKRRKMNATEEGYENKRMLNMTSAGSLLKDSSAWRLMMNWAKDKIGYPDFDSKIREFGSRYIHDEWRPLIDVIFMSSDPSNEDPWPPSALVEEAMWTHGVSFDENEGMMSMTSAGSLLKDLSAWHLIMNWAEDKVGYPNFDTKIREFGSWYIHDEWRSLIDTIFTSSDPSTEDPRSPSALVEEAMRTHGVSFAAPADLSSVSTSQCNPPPECSATFNVGRFLDLAAEEEDNEEEDDEDKDEDEDIGDAQGSVSYPTDPGPSGKEFFNWAVDKIAADPGRCPDSPVEEVVHSRPLFSAQNFMHEFMKSKGVEVTALPWLPCRLYVAGSSPVEVQQYLPPSHRTSAREITLVPPTEGTSLSTIKTWQILPSDSTNAVLVVAPRKHPYDLLQQSGEKSLFCDELAILAGLTLEPILSPAGVGIGFTCGGHDFIYGLLRLTIPTHSVTVVGLPHPDKIAFHMITNFEQALVEQTVQLFSAQFCQGTLVDVDWHKRTASVSLHTVDVWEWDSNKEVVVHCPIQELHRVFTTGQAVWVIAGPYHGYIGHVIAAYGGTVSLQYDGQSPNLEVSDLLLESHVPDHVQSLNTKHTGINIPLHEPTPTILPGDTVEVCAGAYKGAEAPIEWMSMDGTAWIYVKEKQDPSSAPSGIRSSIERRPNQQDDLIMVPMQIHEIRVHPATHTLSFSKERGYDVCVGDSVEIARGKWFRSEGVVHVVDFDKASLDLVCNMDGHKINVPITFCRKTAEHSDLQLS
ncbi:hypothetical protein SCLCIDRAFT_31904 [Scleroderma citrinum Foug A]|uniref:KOW domain-containing protein n=1 Tax=Scleroderma citrinum Foug A TaxID=1036808 RepID=A0A0C3DAL2_9AGAM|nr:hypothetical protein SCLCIDRAFT_31904 [Scleroderma citrinum Foug A]